MTKEALKLALEVMRNQGDVSVDEWIATEKAIKEALANEALEKMAENARELGLDYEPAQEPVAWMNQSDNNFFSKQKDTFTSSVPLYTTPPQRTWAGLTDGEVDKMILLMGFPPDWITENAIVKNIVRNLEAKLKEKNNG